MRPTVKLSMNLADFETSVTTVNEEKIELNNTPVIAEETGEFDEDIISRAFSELYASLEKVNRLQDAVILKKPFKIIGHEVVITLDNNTQLQRFQQEFKAELTNFIRMKTKNSQLNVSAILSEIEESTKIIYTVEEKFKFLLNKYPQLNAFRKDLNLEI